MKSAFLPALSALLLSLSSARSQAPGVPVHDDNGTLQSIASACETARNAGGATPVLKLREQMSRRQCELTLPPAATQKKPGPEVWEAARKGSVYVVAYYLCPRCSKWHTNVAGGYVLTSDGAIATCEHVARVGREMREGFLMVVDSSGKAWPVTEILAVNPHADVCILRAQAQNLTPLPLNPDTKPGETVFCLSSPQEHFAMFTEGIISRFYLTDAMDGRRRRAEKDREKEKAAATEKSPQAAEAQKKSPQENPSPPAPERPGSQGESATFMAVTLDFAAGSSGSPILDDRGNAIGHVQSTQPVFWSDDHSAGNHQMTLHQASTAREILHLIRQKKP